MTDELFTTREVSELTGATFRQLDYWCTTGLIADKAFPGSGKYRVWTEEQLVRARRLVVAGRLRNMRLDQLVEVLAKLGIEELPQ